MDEGQFTRLEDRVKDLERRMNTMESAQDDVIRAAGRAHASPANALGAEDRARATHDKADASTPLPEAGGAASGHTGPRASTRTKERD